MQRSGTRVRVRDGDSINAEEAQLDGLQSRAIAASSGRGRRQLNPADHAASRALNDSPPSCTGSLVAVDWEPARAVAVIQLNDPNHFNALSGEIGISLATAVDFLKSESDVCACVLQGNGPHFCVGANPYDRHAVIPLADMAAGILSLARSCCKLRELQVPTVASIHGHVVGGGMAVALNACYMCASHIARASVVADVLTTLMCCAGSLTNARPLSKATFAVVRLAAHAANAMSSF